MDNELFMNTELPPPSEMAMHFEQPSSSSAMLNWGLMDPNLARNSPPQDCFMWEKSTEQQQSIFDSALSSLVSSPTPSNSNFSGGGGDGFIIRELIGKLGNIGNTSGDIYGAPMNGNDNPLPAASPSPSFSKTAERKEVSEEKGGKRRREDEGEEEEGNKGGNDTKPPEPPKDYIHVRARRGQATDSHSLAERVRREKIGERMKLLQDLVPGCNKVTGKALMLDEIINYVQSLQRQVEFLSMKLSSVNDTRLEFNVDALVSKDAMISSSGSRVHESGLQLESLSHHNYNNNSQLHTNVSSNNMMLHSPMKSLEPSALARGFTHLPTLTQFTDTISQYQMFSEEDLQSIVGMGVAHNPNHESQSQNMKIEL
ncbi:hypothetical protein BRARA_F02999 [Brassica rapa]|uniref:BHLH domain-containing protein n=1 Tax=Brassica campestris TaxID=3711 RepID=A0A397Z8V2_BRACM|nr:hypothetical protein BRARA_F02999 [Brassica rapa]